MKLFTFSASQSRKQKVSDSSLSVRPSCLSSLRFSMNWTFKTSQYHFCTWSIQTKPKALLLKIDLITTHTTLKPRLNLIWLHKNNYSEGMKNEITRHTGMIKWIWFVTKKCFWMCVFKGLFHPNGNPVLICPHCSKLMISWCLPHNTRTMCSLLLKEYSSLFLTILKFESASLLWLECLETAARYILQYISFTYPWKRVSYVEYLLFILIY